MPTPKKEPTPAELRLEKCDAEELRPGLLRLTLERGDGTQFQTNVDAFFLDEIAQGLRLAAIRSAPQGMAPPHEPARPPPTVSTTPEGARHSD